jgi:beta-galactosidase
MLDYAPVWKEHADKQMGKACSADERFADVCSADEFILTVGIVLDRDTAWAEAGYEVAFKQFILPPVVPKKPSGQTPVIIKPSAKINCQIKGKCICISFNDSPLSYVFDNGLLTSVSVSGKNLLLSPPRPNFWRAATDNDRRTGHGQRCGVWRYAGDSAELRDTACRETDGGVTVSSRQSTAMCIVSNAAALSPRSGNSEWDCVYFVAADGRLHVSAVLRPGDNLPEIPEIGMLWELDGSLTNLSWYGKGPFETYWDRQSGAKIGLYSGTVAGQYEPHILPQENGYKTGVRSAVLTGDGRTLTIEGEPTFEMSVLPYTPEEIQSAKHYHELPQTDHTVLRVNYKQMGVGGDRCWGDTAVAHPQYLLYANREYRYSYSVLAGVN